MSSEKWFDWESNESNAAEESSKPETNQEPSQEANPESVSSAEPTPQPEPEALSALHVSTETVASVDAARPFHLWILGHLQNHERERLVELLTRENFGIREVDLDIQFEAGKVLLPRISEFAAMLVAQALRGANIHLELLPSDDDPAKMTEFHTSLNSYENHPSASSTVEQHPAEKLPVTNESYIPGHESALPIDVLIATGMIAEPEWKAKRSDHYSQMVEALKRELRFKAYIKKADALVRFEAQILSTPWVSEKECRIQVRAQAVRFQHSD